MKGCIIIGFVVRVSYYHVMLEQFFIGKTVRRYCMKENDFPMKQKAICAGWAETYIEIVTSWRML